MTQLIITPALFASFPNTSVYEATPTTEKPATLEQGAVYVGDLSEKDGTFMFYPKLNTAMVPIEGVSDTISIVTTSGRVYKPTATAKALFFSLRVYCKGAKGNALWIKCRVAGRLKDVLSNVTPGTNLFITGNLEIKQEGKYPASIEVFVNSFKFASNKDDVPGGENQSSNSQGSTAPKSTTKALLTNTDVDF